MKDMLNNLALILVGLPSAMIPYYNWILTPVVVSLFAFYFLYVLKDEMKFNFILKSWAVPIVMGWYIYIMYHYASPNFFKGDSIYFSSIAIFSFATFLIWLTTLFSKKSIPSQI